MLIFALFVAIVADGISEKFDSLKKGKSAVSACRHGWHWAGMGGTGPAWVALGRHGWHWAGMGGTGPAWVDSLKKRKSAVITTRLCT
jgi:shikimate kinase